MFLSICEIMSTIIGALAGSIASSRVKMDLFGVIVCGTLAALGGGTVRDLLLDIPVYWTLPSGEIFVLAAVVTSLGTFYVAQKYPPPMGTIRVADAIVLALFGMIGTEKSYLHGYTPTVSVMMGICTGVTCSPETFPTCSAPGNCTPPRPSWEAWRTRCFTTSGSTPPPAS